MNQIDAVYENGVFRPVEPIDLPEHMHVLVAVPMTIGRPIHDVREVLGRRHASSATDTAARHDEHQP